MAKDNKDYIKRLMTANKTLTEAQAKEMIRATEGGEKREVVMTRGDKVKAVPVKWLWPRYLPLGTPLCFSGASGAGKSPVVTDIAARVTNPELGWPDGAKNEGEARDVLFVSSEDSITSIVVPRLVAAGADLSHVFFIEGSRRENSDGYLDLLALDADLAAVREKVKEIPDLALGVIDPITNHLGRAKYTDTQQVRSVLMPVNTDLCQERGVCLIYVTHINRRDSETTAVQQLVLGAEAYVGMSRMGYFFGKSDEDDKYEHTMAEHRNASSASLRYRTGSKDFTHDGEEFKDVRTVEWIGESKATAQEIMSTAPREDKSKLLDGFVLKMLSRDRGTPVKTVQTELEKTFPEIPINQGVMSRIQKRNKAVIVSYQVGKSDWQWKLKGDSRKRGF